MNKKRQMDLKVVTNVLGYELVQNRDVFWMAVPGENRAEPIPKYSTDLQEALLLVQTVVTKGYQFSIVKTHNLYEVFIRNGTRQFTYEGTIKELPTVICHAILKATPVIRLDV